MVTLKVGLWRFYTWFRVYRHLLGSIRTKWIATRCDVKLQNE